MAHGVARRAAASAALPSHQQNSTAQHSVHTRLLCKNSVSPNFRANTVFNAAWRGMARDGEAQRGAARRGEATIGAPLYQRQNGNGTR